MKDIEIPDHVKEEMRIHEIRLDPRMSRGMVREMIDACHYDRKLVDNPHAVTLRDKMKKPPKPKAADKTYAQLILDERDGKKREHDEECPSHGHLAF